MWVRDASIMAKSLLGAGFSANARRLLEFLIGVMGYSGKPFNPIYTVGGLKPAFERQIAWLSGAMDSKPVRIGNSASLQIQLDAEGYFMDLAYSLCEMTNDYILPKTNWNAIERVVSWVSENWQLSDCGIWEEPFPAEFTYSKFMMLVCLDRALKLSDKIGNKIEGLKQTMDHIRQWIMDNCVKDGCFVRASSSDEVDASLLMLPIYGFVSFDDPIFKKT